jgi:hypothetical protein
MVYTGYMFYPLVAMMNKTFVFKGSLRLFPRVDRDCLPAAFTV